MNHLEQVNASWHTITTTPGLVSAIIILLATCLVYAVKAFAFRRLMRRLETSPVWWDEALLYGLSLPLTVFIFTQGFSWVLVANAKLLQLNSSSLDSARQVLTVLMIAWALFRFAESAEEGYVKMHKDADKSTVHVLMQLMRAVVFVMAAMIVLQMYQIPISGVLAFGGVGAAAVAFAAKDLLGNFFGGLMIYLDRPFKVGDWVRSPDKAIEGTVEYIGWRLTRIRTFEKRPLYVPNGIFSNIIVENPSRMLKRRLNVVIGIRYDDASKLPAILNDLRAMIDVHDKIDKSENYYVHLVEFGATSLNILLSAHLLTTQRAEFYVLQESIFFKIMACLEKHQAEFAFPTTTLQIPNELQIKTVV